jgi:hypothetical protein
MERSESQVKPCEWRRVGSNHRPRDYESCALPLSYAARGDLSARRGPSPCPCASWRGAWQALRAFACSVQGSLICRLGTGPRAAFRLGGGLGGCGGRIRTDDLRVMSPTSCRCSTPPAQYTAAFGGSRRSHPPPGHLEPGQPASRRIGDRRWNARAMLRRRALLSASSGSSEPAARVGQPVPGLAHDTVLARPARPRAARA